MKTNVPLHLQAGIFVIWVWMILIPYVCMATITVSLFTGPATITSSNRYTFRYQLSGTHGVQGGLTPPTIPVVFFMAPDNTPDVSNDQRLGGVTILAQNVNGIWVAPSFIFEVDLLIPSEITAQSWPSSVRGKGCIPPGTNFIYAWTPPSSSKGISAVVPRIEIHSAAPNPAQVESLVEIRGTFPNSPTRLLINGASVNRAFWSYDRNGSKILATVPRASADSGRIEISTPLETNVSTFIFDLALPDLEFLESPLRPLIISRFTNQTESSLLVGMMPSYLSVTVRNNGNAPSARSSLRVVGDLNILALVEIPPLPISGEFSVSNMMIPPQEAGLTNLQLVLRSSILSHESNELNNSLPLSILYEIPTSVERHLARYLPAYLLADPSKVSEDVDLEDDGFSNMLESCLGTHPLEHDPAFSVRAINGMIELLLPRPIEAGNRKFSLESSSDMVLWSLMSEETDYSVKAVETLSGPRLGITFTSATTAPHLFYRIACDSR